MRYGSSLEVLDDNAAAASHGREYILGLFHATEAAAAGNGAGHQTTEGSRKLAGVLATPV